MKNIFKKIGKFFTDTIGELKKVVWTPKTELGKSTKLVIVTVLAVCVCIAVLDFGISNAISAIAGLVG